MDEILLIDIAFEAQDQINFLWNFYLATSAILLGWILTANIDWDRQKRILAILLFSFFSSVNCIAVYNAYDLLNQTLYELHIYAISIDSAYSNYYDFFIEKTKGTGKNISLIIHIISYFMIVYFIFSRKRKIQTNKTGEIK